MKNDDLTGMRVLIAVFGLAVLTAGSGPLWAQEESRPPTVDPELEKPPPLPPKVQDERIEPTVTIRQEEERRIEEYSLNGRIYMVKVTPDKGPPFYYIDSDGDGTLELDERSRALHPVQPVQWKIAEWK